MGEGGIESDGEVVALYDRRHFWQVDRDNDLPMGESR